MEVNNQTSDPVEYVQNGSGGPQDPTCPKSGEVKSKETKEIDPVCGAAPYKLDLTILSKQRVKISITAISNEDLKVELQ